MNQGYRTAAGLIRRRAAVAIGLLALSAFNAGCLVTTSLPTQAPVLDFVERRTRATYFVYVPSRYTVEKAWPLVVLCHGTPPYDTAWMQMKEWAAFAESNGIIVVAPQLEGTRGDIPPSAATQIERQRRDEMTILGAVAAVRASHNVAEDRIFITGWSGGAYAVLHSGLRHPEVFRALAIRQGNFDPAYMDVTNRLDRWQIIFVYYSSLDLVRDQSEDMVRWLRDQDMHVKEFLKPGSHRRLPVDIAWDFFEDVSKNRPWIRVNALVADHRKPREVHVSLKSTPEAVDAIWEFGDGMQLRGLAARHDYQADGTFTITAKVRLANGKWYQRTEEVTVPRAAIGMELGTVPE